MAAILSARNVGGEVHDAEGGVAVGGPDGRRFGFDRYGGRVG
jgi:hypothetical protein